MHLHEKMKELCKKIFTCKHKDITCEYKRIKSKNGVECKNKGIT